MIFALLAFFIQCCLCDMYLQGKDGDHAQPWLHDRFYEGPNKAFIGKPYDFSGVGQTSNLLWATMISPSYFLSATHWHPQPGQQIFFRKTNSLEPKFAYEIDNFGFVTTIDGKPCDLYLGRLTKPLHPNHSIAIYPVLELPNFHDYRSLEILTVGIPNRVGRNNITGIVQDWVGHSMTPVLTFDYFDVGAFGEDTSYVMPGDSGGPSFFVLKDGRMAILGTHYINEHDDGQIPKNGWRSGDSFVPPFIQQLNENMSDEKITIVTE